MRHAEHCRCANCIDGENRVAATAFVPWRARKVAGSYQAEGTIIAQFQTLAGKDRVVFEFDEPKGMLHIFDRKQVEATPPAGVLALFRDYEAEQRGA